MKNIFFAFLTLFAVVLTTGCENKNSEKKISTENQESPQGEINIVQVNDHIITSKILGKKANEFLKFNQTEQKKIIDQLVQDEIIAQYVLKENNDTNLFENERERIMQSFKYIAAMALKDINASTNDENLSKIYEKTKEQYWHKEHYEASHILVKTESEALDIIKELEETSDFNNTFVQLSKEKSLSKVAKNGGYLGHFEKDIMEIPFIEALKKLQLNTFTKTPIKTKEGYHVIYLHSIEPEGYVPFEKVKKSIEHTIKRFEIEEWAYEKFNELKKEAKIIYFDLKNN